MAKDSDHISTVADGGTDPRLSSAAQRTALPIPSLPQDLAGVDAAVQRICQALAGCPDFASRESHLRQQLPRLFACSPYATELCERDPMLLLRDELLYSSITQSSHSLDELREQVAQLADEEQVMRTFRTLRNSHMLGIIWRELIQGADVQDTLSDLSLLADICITQALCYAHAKLALRFGEPVDASGRRQKLIALAMGKLGGNELNFSSDIDLILVYPSSGQTDISHLQCQSPDTAAAAERSSSRKRQIDNSEFFKKQAQMLVKLLGKITEDGFVFRVDLRLRPFGESGPLVMNFDGVEHYYLTQGREWERYAMIKARPLGGEGSDCNELMAMLKPFVYRRYLDYSAVASLRDLKARISAEVISRGMQNNVKLGPGGIREIEFIGQAFQLVRGGREPGLQCRSIVSVLQEVGRLDLMQQQEVDSLTEAYFFLRRTENFLQMMRDQQVHTLPAEEVDQQRLAYAMSFSSWNEFRQTLDLQLSIVQASFRSLFQDEDDTQDASDDPYAHVSFSNTELGPTSNPTILLEILQSRGFNQPAEMLDAITSLTGGAFYRNLSPTAQRRLDKILPLILRTVENEEESWRAFNGLLNLVRSVAGRSVYLQVLCETPAALARLARLFGRSTWLAEFVSQHPIVIDELLDHRQLEELPQLVSLRQEMSVVTERVAQQDLDVQMDSLRQFRQAATLRVAAADLESRLDLMQVSDCLSWIAEVNLQAVSDLVWDQLIALHGKPSCIVDSEQIYPGFAIVAYGKLGGLELGYGSDLDIVFLHESEGTAQRTTGDRSIENQVFFARLAQKVVHFINTLTPAGIMYEVDTRLRPNGQSGMLVSSVAAFDRYQQSEAWTWEHQALVRARVVVGNDRIRSRFAELRRAVLCRSRDAETLRAEVAQMRQKMRSALGSDNSDTFDLKQDAGGIADIEFMVQYIVLSRSAEFPELTIDTDNVRILDRVGKLGLLQHEIGPKDAQHNSLAEELKEAYLAYRRTVHKLALLDQEPRIEADSESEVRLARIVGIWNSVMG